MTAGTTLAGRIWIAGVPAAMAAVSAAIAAADPGAAGRLRAVGEQTPTSLEDPIVVCLDVSARAAEQLPSFGPIMFTSPDALQSLPGALERLLSHVRTRQDTNGDRWTRERGQATAATGGTEPDGSSHLREALVLLERQIALNAEAVGLAREMTKLAGTPSWVVARWSRGSRMVLARLRGRARRLAVPPRPDLSGQPLGVNVAGYLRAESGMGEAARASVRAFEAARVPVALNDVDGPVRTCDDSFTRFDRENPHAVNLVHLNADNMEAFARARGRGYFRGRYTVGYWFWELSRFPREWQPAFDQVHEVWVASTFVRNAIASDAPVPVTCVPPAVTLPEADHVGRAHFGLPADPFVFLFTFDVSSQFERKNPLGLVRAFRQANLGDAAFLVLKFTNSETNPAAVRALHEAADGLPVRLVDGYLSRGELAALVRVADGCVSLHRSEGFGLTMAEAMLLDKPVVATGYSGNLEFMTDDTAWLVRHRLVSLDRDHGPYRRGFEWAAPDESHAAALMTEIVLNPDATRARAIRGGQHARRLLSIDAAAARVRQRLEAIYAGAPAPVDARAKGRDA